MPYHHYIAKPGKLGKMGVENYVDIPWKSWGLLL